MNKKLLIYDISDYKQLEDDLNNLASKGMMCTKVARLASFKKTTNKQSYFVDCFIPVSKNRFKKHAELDTWIKNHEDYDQEHIGHLGKMHVFVSTNKRGHRDYDELYDYFNISATANKMIQIIFSALFSYYFFNQIITTYTLQPFISNGRIITHYFTFITSMIYLLRSIVALLQTRTTVKSLKNKVDSPSILLKTKKVIFSSLLVSILLLLSGLVIDSCSYQSSTDKPLLRLEAFGIEGEKLDYTQSSSILFPSNYSYIQYSKDFTFDNNNPSGDILSVRYYEGKDSKRIERYINHLIVHPELKSASKLEMSDLYPVYYCYDQDNVTVKSILLHQDDIFIEISTTFDLNNDILIKKIVDFYFKDLINY